MRFLLIDYHKTSTFTLQNTVLTPIWCSPIWCSSATSTYLLLLTKCSVCNAVLTNRLPQNFYIHITKHCITYLLLLTCSVCNAVLTNRLPQRFYTHITKHCIIFFIISVTTIYIISFVKNNFRLHRIIVSFFFISAIIISPFKHI